MSSHIHIPLKILVFLCCINSLTYGQTPNKFLFAIDRAEFISGFDNDFSIVTQQDTPITIEQVEAFLRTPYTDLMELEPRPVDITQAYYGNFRIHPDSIGLLQIKVRLKSGIETTTVPVKPITAVVRMSLHGSNEDNPIGANEMKAQKGLIAWVECCGFDARCTVTNFEVIRIGSNHLAESAQNEGGKFENKVHELIKKAESGDLFIFRKIWYLCPGGQGKQRSEDMIFEIK